MPGVASGVPAVEAGLALSPALAWAPDLHPVRCEEVQGPRVSADSAPSGRGMARPASGHFFHLPWWHGLVAKDVVAEPGCLDWDPGT